ncbi:MAG: LysM peptidoglycan-binding domain-containing protein [candidate division KSB1 bacterium]
MKKSLFAVSSAALVLVLLAQQDVLWSRLQFLDAPRVYVIQKGESLSQLAQAHYGDTDYWRELALVNRAPRPNHIQPGEEILLPAANVVQELRRARTISRVNDLINAQHALATRVAPVNAAPENQAALEATQPATETATVAMGGNAADPVVLPVAQYEVQEAVAYNDEPVVEEGSSSWFWLIFGVLALGGVVGFVVYRRRHEEEVALAQDDKLKANGVTPNFQMDRRPQGTSKVERVVL